MSEATFRYFSTPLLKTVAPSLPPHRLHVPPSGGRRGLKPHFRQRARCDVYVRRFPTRSRSMWVDRTFRATSSPFTAIILFGSSLYELMRRPRSRSSVGWVNPIFQAPLGDERLRLRVGMRSSISFGLALSNVFSLNFRG